MKQKIPLYLKIISWFLTIFTGLMVSLSFFDPINFYKSYGVEGSIPFQISWSFRYLVIFILMILGNLFGRPETLIIAILGRFFIDLFDLICVILYNTPPLNFFHGVIQFTLLFGVQLFACYKLNLIRKVIEKQHLTIG